MEKHRNDILIKGRKSVDEESKRSFSCLFCESQYVDQSFLDPQISSAHEEKQLLMSLIL